MSGVELLPCPFCGGPGHLQFSAFDIDEGWHVVCHGKKECPLYCSEPYRAFDTENQAIAAWNARTPAQGLDAATIERCAQVAENKYPANYPEGWTGREIATAIRALNTASTTTRGEKNDG